MVTGSDTCLRVQGESLNLLGTLITNQGVSYGCSTVNEGDDVDAVQSFLDSSPNTTQDGSIPAAVDLPDDGFFENTGSLGSDVDSWRGNWVFGL